MTCRSPYDAQNRAHLIITDKLHYLYVYNPTCTSHPFSSLKPLCCVHPPWFQCVTRCPGGNIHIKYAISLTVHPHHLRLNRFSITKESNLLLTLFPIGAGLSIPIMKSPMRPLLQFMQQRLDWLQCTMSHRMPLHITHSIVK